MTTNINNIIETVQTRGTTLSHQLPDHKLGARHFRSSTFIRNQKLLIKGEYENPNSTQRNALLVFFDLSSGKVKGADRATTL